MIRKKIVSGHGCHNFNWGTGLWEWDGWKTEIFSYSELQQIGMLTILQRLTSALRQLRDGTRYGMTQSEGNQVQNHVDGTLHRMMWQNCKILCKDVWHFVYGFLKTYPWLMTINQMGKVTHSFSLPKQKQADSTSTFLNLRDHQAPAICWFIGYCASSLSVYKHQPPDSMHQ